MEADDFFVGDYWFKDVKFYVEYITDNNLVVKHDKEDLTEIDFYSEMKINQDENIINLTRGSRKAYGDLQRTSNKQFSFQKVHHKLSDQYVMGMTDINDFTITNVETQWHNYHFLSTYTVTKHFNRIAQATFIDQAYRPFYQYNKDIMVRKDNYKDYLIATPPEIATDVLVNSLISNRAINVILSTLKGRRYIEDETTKASTVLIRTDGTLWYYPDDEANGYNNFVTTPLSAAGVKGGFTFDFAFAHNLVAEDFIEKDPNAEISNVWYNRAIRYTDEYGRIRYLEFIILDGTLPFEQDLDGGMIELMERYPLMRLTELETQIFTIQRYFGMEPVKNEVSPKSLIINKDTRTNYGLTYQIGIVSKYFRMYIFGQSFFSKNFIVSNVADFMNDTMYFYGYADAPNYKIFEDLKVKKGYRVKIPITNNNLVIQPTTIQGGVGIRFQGDLNTSSFVAWALGDGEGNLYVAHNGQKNGFDLIPTHFREGLKEIGKKAYELSYVVREHTTAPLLVSFSDIDIISGEVVSMVLEPNTELNSVKADKYKTEIVIGVSVTDNNVSGEVLYLWLEPNTEVGTVVSKQYNGIVKIGVESSQQDIQGERLELGLLLSTFYNHGTSIKHDTTIPTIVELNQEDLIGEVVDIGVNLSILYGDIVLLDMIIDTAMSLLVGYNSNNIVGDSVEIGLRQSTFYNYGTNAKYDTTIRASVNTFQENIVGETVEVGINNNSLVTTKTGTPVSYDDTITFGVSTVEEHITQSDYQEVSFTPTVLTNTRIKVPTTTNPSLSLDCYRGVLSATVTNNDEKTANIAVTGAITSNLTSVPSGFSTIFYSSEQLLGLVTVRARATAVGKSASPLISRTYNMDFCPFM